MHAFPSLLASLVLVCAVVSPSIGLAADTPAEVGFVVAVENEAEVVSRGTATAAIIGTAVHMQDELRTGSEGRLKVTFRDNTALTLGEKASVVIERYIFNPDRGIGETVLQTTRGAFRFASGEIKGLRQRKIAISTPVAEIGVRGTEFWGGPINSAYGVLLLEGEVSVSNRAGRVILSAPGQGTDIPSPLGAPGTPSAWPAEKVARAVATVALH
jgi:hypothetical protein